LRAMQISAPAIVKNSLAIALILLASGCKDENGEEFVVSNRFGLCTSVREIVSISLKDGIDATKGQIWVGRSKAEIVIDPHPYYPAPEKVQLRNSENEAIARIDSGKYVSRAGPGEMEFNLSAYQLKDGRNMFVVLSGASTSTTRDSLMQIQSKLCICGSC